MSNSFWLILAGFFALGFALPKACWWVFGIVALGLLIFGAMAEGIGWLVLLMAGPPALLAVGAGVLVRERIPIGRRLETSLDEEQ